MSAGTLRLMTWNIHGAVGTDRRFDLDRVCSTIKRHEPDVIALQEVDSRKSAPGARSPFEVLREAVGEHGIDAKSITTADGDYGQMLVSRWPMRTIDVHDISHGNREPRRAIEAEVLTAAGPLRVIATHLGLSMGERRFQVQRLLEIVKRHPTTTVMLGDFNDWFWPSSLRNAIRHELPARTRHASWPSYCPLLRLDRVFCWPRQTLLRSFVDHDAKRASDHLPVIVDVSLPSPAPSPPLEQAGGQGTS